MERGVFKNMEGGINRNLKNFLKRKTRFIGFCARLLVTENKRNGSVVL